MTDNLYDGRRSLNNVTTANGYTTANTLARAGAIRLTLIVANAAIVYQLGKGLDPATSWGTEVFLPPGLFSFEREFDMIRVRSALAGAAAQVTVEAIGGGDLGG